MEDRSASGCLRGKRDIRDYHIKKHVALAVNLPAAYECTQLPEVKDQGAVGSCVAHATSEILEAQAGCNTKLSTNFIYGIHNKLYGSEGPGMYLREACKIVKDYGDPEYVFCPENTEVREVYKIAEEAFRSIDARNNACQYRIKGYARLANETDVKYALLNYGPVLGSVIWYNDNTVKNGVLIKGAQKSGGHAIMVYGYNEQGFLCLNSWGKKWGNKGKFILPYDYQLDETYVLLPRDKDQDEIAKPVRNDFVDVIYKIINFFINLFR